MSETKENARHWSGYVCPDCRFVFRVPQDHDGQGIVCPSCRRILRIPSAHDVTPPLLKASGSLSGEEQKQGVSPDTTRTKKGQRRKKSRQADGHGWDRSQETSKGSRHVEKRWMFWMLIGGVSLFALIVAGVFITLGNSRNAPQSLVVAPTEETAESTKSRVTVPPPDTQRNYGAFLAEAEPIARKFLEATCIEDMLPLVRDPDRMEPRMRRFYPDGKIKAPGLSAFDAESGYVRRGNTCTLVILTGDHEAKPMFFVESQSSIKVDWESWVGWSDMPWEEFLAKKPVEPVLFRVKLGSVDYYNFAFSDDRKWKSWILNSPDGTHMLYGYSECNSKLSAELALDPDAKDAAMILSLRFPANAASAKQVIIDKFIASGWVMETKQ